VLTPQFIDETPEVFHARRVGDARLTSGAALWVPILGPERTLVICSSQRSDTIDQQALAAAQITIASRRTGGGAVLVSESDVVWVDVVIDDTHPHWDTDVSRSFEWLGRACQRALAELGTNTTMHTGRLHKTTWSPLICFAGLGPGELTIETGTTKTGTSQKVLGISQRRTRDRARFQIAILKRWSGSEHASFLAPELVTDQTTDDLERVATPLPHSSTEILDAIVIELNR